MLYTVGTHIDFQKKPEVVQSRKADRLYMPGTRLIFIRVVEGMNVLKITPDVFAIVRPAGA